MKSLLIVLCISSLFLGCGDEEDHDEVVYNNIVYYGDVNSDSIVAINLDTMSLQTTISSNGVYPYEIASGFNDDLYVINRKDYSIGLLDSTSNTIVDQISLNFIPRSTAINGEDTLITGVNEPSASLVQKNLASASYNDSTYLTPSSFGGANATGHPQWIDDSYFLLLDRTENSIEVYQKDTYTPISKVITSSSVHHVLQRDGIYYGIMEGEQNVSAPGILKFNVTNGVINVLQEQLLSALSNLPTDFVSASWGSHHGALHPSEDFIYFGSNEGNVFVLDLATLSLQDTFKSGKGIGHFLFYNNMLITTNHHDNFKSFYDVSDPRNNQLLKNLSFSNEIYSGITMQSHTSHIYDNAMYFTFNTDQNSTLYKVSLSSLEIMDSLVLDRNYLLMGSMVSSSSATSGM